MRERERACPRALQVDVWVKKSRVSGRVKKGERAKQSLRLRSFLIIAIVPRWVPTMADTTTIFVIAALLKEEQTPSPLSSSICTTFPFLSSLYPVTSFRWEIERNWNEVTKCQYYVIGFHLLVSFLEAKFRRVSMKSKLTIAQQRDSLPRSSREST